MTKLLDKNPDRRPSAEDIVSLSALRSIVQRLDARPGEATKRPGALKSRVGSSNADNVPCTAGDGKVNQKDAGTGLPRHRKGSVQCVAREDQENVGF